MSTELILVIAIPGVLILAGLVIFIIKHSKKEVYTGGPYYFRSYGSYRNTDSLSGKITFVQAQDMEAHGRAYYVAQFDDKGKLLSVDKHYQGTVDAKFPHPYSTGSSHTGSDAR